MNMSSILPRRWRAKADATRHNEAVAGILATPPIEPRADGLVLFSMIGTAVLLPYLVAVKSLWHELRRGRVAILDDGTLTAQDKAVLAHHCGDPEIFSIAQVQIGPFPRGGCWERFLTILDHRHAEYWIQLDSDTVTLGPVPEIERAIATNRSFTLLGGVDSGEPLPFKPFAERHWPKGPQDGHIQAQVESRMGLSAKADWKYVRGCAGFAGFAAGGPGRTLAAAFLEQMAALVGQEQMATWGTEQIASNFHIANEPSPVMLPYARYMNYWNEAWAPDTAFVHFVGTHRHANGAYVGASLAAVARLKG
jgi:hypothetical protein